MNKKIIPLVNISDPKYSPSRPSIGFKKTDLAPGYQQKYDQGLINFDKNLNKFGRYCYHPFNTITVDGEGDVYLCICQAWLPISVGKIWEFSSLKDIVSSNRARELQTSIVDGSYKYCDNNNCGIIKEDSLEESIVGLVDNINWINFAVDASCNLTCPSCRTSFKFISDGPEFDRRLKIINHLIKLIEGHDHVLKFTLSGDGDPFASLLYRELLYKLDLTKSPNVEIEIVTNGVLIAQHWDHLKKIHKNIVGVKISIDAGSKEIYNLVRRGGDWDKLINGIKFLNEWRSHHNKDLHTTANFVVQKTNFKDILSYVKLCQSLSFDHINLQKLDNWGTFTDFNAHAVHLSSHPDHAALVKILNDPIMSDRTINLTNLSDLNLDKVPPLGSVNISDLVKLKNQLSMVSFRNIEDSLNDLDETLTKLHNIPMEHDYTDEIDSFLKSVDLAEQLITDINSKIPIIKSKIASEITKNTKRFLKRGYEINGVYGSNKASVDFERSQRPTILSSDTLSVVLDRIHMYTDWHYPALEIGPGDGFWTRYLVAADPLYIIDIEPEYLDNTVKQFNPVYQNRIRKYLTGGWAAKDDFDFTDLPLGQFSFIFSWNVFDYFPLHETRRALTQCFNLLRDGGTMMFSFNNCDVPACVKFVESGAKSWMPTELLINCSKEIGFEVHKIENPEETVSWIEIKKPGTLKTVKAHQVLGKIISRNA